MPRYEYACEACGKSFEVTQKMSDAPLTDCECGAKGTVQRLVGAGGGLIFKGSGFYSNDYKSSTKSAPAEASEKKSTSDAKPDAKPAAPAKTGHSCGPGCSH